MKSVDGKLICGHSTKGDSKRPCGRPPKHPGQHYSIQALRLRRENTKAYLTEHKDKYAARMPEYDRRRIERHPFYNIWRNIKVRCLNPGHKAYPDYGGRGIKMHEPWAEDYKAFEAWVLESLGPRPSKSHSIERIDNFGNYEPGNLKWATWQEQRTNQRPRFRNRERDALLARIQELEAV